MEIRHTRGTESLEVQRLMLREREGANRRLVAFTRDDPDHEGKPRNAATFEILAIALPDLVFIEVPGPGQLSKVFEEQTKQRQSFIFFSEVFVLSQKKFVAGFREKQSD